MKKAMLVTVSLMTRVVVDVDASEKDIFEQARDKFIVKVHSELGENLEEIVEDTEQPFDPKFDKE